MRLPSYANLAYGHHQIFEALRPFPKLQAWVGNQDGRLTDLYYEVLREVMAPAGRKAWQAVMKMENEPLDLVARFRAFHEMERFQPLRESIRGFSTPERDAAIDVWVVAEKRLRKADEEKNEKVWSQFIKDGGIFNGNACPLEGPILQAEDMRKYRPAYEGHPISGSWIEIPVESGSSYIQRTCILDLEGKTVSGPNGKKVRVVELVCYPVIDRLDRDQVPIQISEQPGYYGFARSWLIHHGTVEKSYIFPYRVDAPYRLKLELTEENVNTFLFSRTDLASSPRMRIKMQQVYKALRIPERKRARKGEWYEEGSMFLLLQEPKEG